MASRTRERLIDVARQLFARKGLEKTTMNDIATASDRGRRTIYTYFRTKEDIYQAVIDSETQKILDALDAVIVGADSPRGKLRALMDFRMHLASENAHSFEVWYKGLFNRDVKRSQSIRAKVARRLFEVTTEIVDEGVASGDFDPEQARRLPSILAMTIRANDVTTLREPDDWQSMQWLKDTVDFICAGVCRKNNNETT